jgi:hypothetical protein
MAAWFDGVDLKVEIAFGAGPGSALGTGGWTDVTAYVRSIDIGRGRAYERDTFQPGRTSVVLDNRDRRFDPEYSGSPYAPNVLPLRQLKVTMTYSGTPYTRFVGYVQGWPQSWDDQANVDSTVTVVALDWLSVAALAALPDDVYAATVKADAPFAWWRLGEQDGTTAFDSSGNLRIGTYLGGATFNARAGVVPGSTNSAIRFDGIDDAARAQVPVIPQAYPLTVEFWISSPTTGLSANTFWVSMSDGLGRSIQIGLSGSSSVAGADKLYVETADISAIGIAGASLVAFSNPVTSGAHHIAMTLTAIGAYTMYVDGVAATVSFTGGAGSVGSSFPLPLLSVSPAGGAVTLDEFASYSSSLSAARILAHAQASTTGAGETVSARISRLITDSGSTITTALESSQQTVQATSYASAPLGAALQVLATTEQGRLFVDRSGSLVLHTRYHDLLNATLVVVPSDATGATFRYSALGHDYDARWVVNDATVTRSGGVAQRVTDATSITAYGTRSASVSGTLGQSDAEAADLAAYLVQRNKAPTSRFPSIEIRPRANTAAWAPVCGVLDIGSKVSVVRTPQGIGSAIGKDLIVEAITERWTREGEWVVTLQTSPVDTANGNFLVLDDPTKGQLDANRLGF